MVHVIGNDPDRIREGEVYINFSRLCIGNGDEHRLIHKASSTRHAGRAESRGFPPRPAKDAGSYPATADHSALRRLA
jgi:hypothetical protein